MKKVFVLVVLFVLPVVAYLFFASGVNNFGKLPTLTKEIRNVSKLDAQVSFKNKITILGFLGNNLDNKKGAAFNLNQKIYKRFFAFKDFQFVMVVPKGMEEEVEVLKKELSALSTISKWHFVFAEIEDVQSQFNSLKTNLELDKNYATPYVFIVDKDLNLRGRTDDKDEGTKYGFNANSVADLNNKMEDDVKIILAEYRMALKKNAAVRN
ncbi:hypothetical protein [uncultured Maribacter sp.]|uniref:hypothetical protein n=1 Tax=uncultured Maribacter sp. TaxID=431308 RepID=UPI00260D67BD|nr:hypothetical protein [uncultured Maribacter sp.]